MSLSDLYHRIDPYHPAHVSIPGGRRSGLWATPRPADLRIVLFFAVTWLFLSVFAGSSAFVMAIATALTLCANLVYLAHSNNLARWTHYIAWALRAAAVITGWWLFVATPTMAGSFLAVLLFAGLYFVCERGVWRRRQMESA